MDYLQIASDIYQWLNKYQINQSVVSGKVENSNLSFMIDHPVDGSIKIQKPISNEMYFRNRGIGFNVRSLNGNNVDILVYDYGGIYDPVDKLVPGDHYAATHYALLGAILYQSKQNDELLEDITRAATFFFNSKNEEYYFDNWYYHWDFHNYSMMETYHLLNVKFDADEKTLKDLSVSEIIKKFNKDRCRSW